ncbi:MAG: hypothetical protein JWN21_2650 [Sphingomonas bacterium]|nr:hypothetical protein [Sphingomonas bacterium]
MTDDGLGNACAGLGEDVLVELRAIARVATEANGLVLTLATKVGGAAGAVLDRLPIAVRDRLGDLTEAALRESYRVAFRTQDGPVAGEAGWASGPGWHRAATAVTGAIGGLGGIATTIAELPVTTTLILRSIQEVARGHGEDLADPDVRAACIAVFGLGGPGRADDQADTGLVAVRLALSGKTVAPMIAAVLARYGVMVGQKALAQATPLIGAAVGATLNPAFTGFYQNMADVHFRLRKLERAHDPERIGACYDRIAARLGG